MTILGVPFATWITLFPFLASFLVALAIALYDWLEQHLPAARRAQVETLVQTVVTAIEQRDQGASGPAKKAAATQAIQTILATWHVHIPDILIEMLLESAVAALPKSPASGVSTPLAAMAASGTAATMTTNPAGAGATVALAPSASGL